MSPTEFDGLTFLVMSSRLRNDSATQCEETFALVHEIETVATWLSCGATDRWSKVGNPTTPPSSQVCSIALLGPAH